MLIDMHMHEKTFSEDSYLSLEEIVTRAKELKLDGICITDHESMGLREYAEYYSKIINYPIFVGAEYLTAEGDILVFGIDKLPEKPMMPVMQFLKYVESKGGISIAAHPYRKNNRGLEDNLKYVYPLHGIECFNGSTPYYLNKQSLDVAQKRGLHMVGASDCHIYDQIGVFATHVPNETRTVEDLVRAFKDPTTNIYPVKYNVDGYIPAFEIAHAY